MAGRRIYFEVRSVRRVSRSEALDVRDIRSYGVDLRCGGTKFINRAHLLLDRVPEDLIGVVVAL